MYLLLIAFLFFMLTPTLGRWPMPFKTSALPL